MLDRVTRERILELFEDMRSIKYNNRRLCVPKEPKYLDWVINMHPNFVYYRVFSEEEELKIQEAIKNCDANRNVVKVRNAFVEEVYKRYKEAYNKDKQKYEATLTPNKKEDSLPKVEPELKKRGRPKKVTPEPTVKTVKTETTKKPVIIEKTNKVVEVVKKDGKEPYAKVPFNVILDYYKTLLYDPIGELETRQLEGFYRDEFKGLVGRIAVASYRKGDSYKTIAKLEEYFSDWALRDAAQGIVSSYKKIYLSTKKEFLIKRAVVFIDYFSKLLA